MSQNETDRDGNPDSAAAHEPATLMGFVAAGAWKLATRGPRLALDLAQKGISEAEKVALSTLRKRMDAVADEEALYEEDDHHPSSAAVQPAAAAGETQTRSRTQQVTPRLTASDVMARLMEASLEQSPETARELLALRLAKQLVPDEARILAALADGHAVALMHVGAGSLVGPATQRWLENLSPVGREAGVSLLDRTPYYLTHLRELGLLDSGDEDKSLQLKYQLLEADTQVRKTCEEIEKSGYRPKFFRRTIRISDVGKAFWAACEPKERQSW